MGYLKPQETDLLYLPSDPEHKYWVRMRKRAPFGVVVEAQSHMLKMSTAVAVDPNPAAPNGNGKLGKPEKAKVISEAEWSGYILALIYGFITEWNLTDDHELPLPLTIESIQMLDEHDGQYLSDQAQARQGATKRGQEEEAPLGKPGRRRSSTNRR